MVDTQVLREVFDLTDPERNVLFGMSLEEAVFHTIFDGRAHAHR